MTYATKVSAHYIARRAAAQAGASQVNFLAGTVIVGDGNGSVPSISDLVAAGGVLHEVWRGAVVTAVSVDEANPAQVDIRFVLPASVGGVEVGPFWVREFVVTDENGVVCVYGTTQIQKTTSGQGQISDLVIVAAIGESDSSVVVVSPPSGDFVTSSELVTAVNTHQPTAEEPLYATDAMVGGWLQRLFRVRRADQADETLGVERPASDAEFAAGAPTQSPWPWPTLQQIKGALDALWDAIDAIPEPPAPPGALTPLSYDAEENRYEIAAASESAVGVGRSATDAESLAGATAAETPTPAWITPEALEARLAEEHPSTDDLVVGSYIIASYPNVQDLAFGAAVSGADLVAYGVEGGYASQFTSPLPGTWKFRGFVVPVGAAFFWGGLWQRAS